MREFRREHSSPLTLLQFLLELVQLLRAVATAVNQVVDLALLMTSRVIRAGGGCSGCVREVTERAQRRKIKETHLGVS